MWKCRSDKVDSYNLHLFGDAAHVHFVGSVLVAPFFLLRLWVLGFPVMRYHHHRIDTSYITVNEASSNNRQVWRRTKHRTEQGNAILSPLIYNLPWQGWRKLGAETPPMVFKPDGSNSAASTNDSMMRRYWTGELLEPAHTNPIFKQLAFFLVLRGNGSNESWF